MNFQRALSLLLLGPWIWTAGATPEINPTPGQPSAEKSLSELITELSAPQFKTREKATQAIWQIGESALTELKKAAQSGDPEQAHRARELILKIDLYITPETDNVVVGLVYRYLKGSTNEKIGLIEQLRKKRAWPQILKLFALETNIEVQTRVADSAKQIAVMAAREELVKGDAAAARRFLEMAPADPVGLIALAAFHESQGTLEEELKRANSLIGHAGSAWRLAIHRVRGDLAAARDAAKDAGEPKISAAMAALSGDPIPWLRLRGTPDPDAEEEEIHFPYTELAIRRWQGKPLRPLDLEPLMRSVNSGDSGERGFGINSLFLLGETGLATKAYGKNQPLEAFSFFEALEQIPEALTALGLDPDAPDYVAWLDKRFTLITNKQLEHEEEDSNHVPELLAFASFFESRGLNKIYPEVFAKPMATLAEKDSEKFVKLLGLFFSMNSMRTGMAGAPSIAREAAASWAGDQVERWNEVISATFGDRDEIRELWDGLAEFFPTSTFHTRFATMLVLCGMEKDSSDLRERWFNLAWAKIDKTPEEERAPLFEQMSLILSISPDSSKSLRLMDMLPKSSRDEFSWRAHMNDLSAAERWDEAATFFLEQIERLSVSKGTIQPFFHASAAACLRKAGRKAEAALQDSLVEKLALGSDSLEIASGYAFGYDYQRAGIWWEKATRLSEPGSDTFTLGLRLHSDMMIANQEWAKMASIAEISAQMAAGTQSYSGSPLLGIRHRIHSDLGRGLANLKTDRSKSIALLNHCRKISPNDGSMADDFYPSLRKAGLIQEHDAWFEEAWRGITAVVERFPNSENTHNTAGWMAARAQRNLGVAEKFLEKALAESPSQAAYLDTMAEIQFARGNRDKAMAWSAKAVNFMPSDPMIRRQHERFRTEALPR